MKRKLNPVEYFFYCFFIIMPIYQDSPFTSFIGSAGASTMPVFSMVGFAVLCLMQRKLYVNKYVKTWAMLGLMLMIVSYALLLVWWLMGNPMTVYQEWLPAKAVKTLLTYFSYIAYVIVLQSFLRRMGPKQIFAPICFTQVLLTVICLIELQQMPYAFRFIHYAGQFPYGRIRLLTRESSWTAVMIITFSLLSIFYGMEYKKRLLALLSSICLLILLSATGSKGLMATTIVAIVFYILYKAKKLNVKSIVLIVLGIVALFIYLNTGGARLRTSLAGDIENYTSMATRSFTIVVGILMGLVFPFGTGAALFTPLFPQFEQRWLQHLPAWLDSSEIISHIYSEDDTGMAVLSGLFQYHAFWGIFGTVIFLSTIFRLGKQIQATRFKRKDILTIVFLADMVMLAAVMSFTYEFWMLIAVLMRLIELDGSRDLGA